MSKKAIDKAADAVKDTVDNARDAAHEIGHRSAAEVEKMKREHDESMTLGEKVGSATKEAKERAQAEVDAAKRDLRSKKTS